MFVKPLAVLLSNMLVCFSVFWYCRSLQWNLGRKSEKWQKKRSMLPASALERRRSDRAHYARPQCPRSSAGLVSLRLTQLPYPALIPSLPAWRSRSFRGSYEQSIAYMIALERNACDRVHYSDLAAPYFCINRTLCKFFRGYIFWERFLRSETHVWVYLASLNL